MKTLSSALFSMSLTAAQQTVIQPPAETCWRIVDIMPSAWITDSTYYALFEEESGYKLTFKGKIDNGALSTIESDDINGVARGFFF